jgi:D-inositol-3-phosphate glycosyltransferase
MEHRPSGELSHLTATDSVPRLTVALLTGGGERHYIVSLATELLAKGIALDVIGSDDLDGPEFHNKPRLNFLNLRGNQQPDVSLAAKVSRILKYYAALIRYAAKSKSGIFHILWNNKFETLDRTLLMLYYRFLGKRVVLTAHNVNSARRDSHDTFLNQLTLRIQYQLADHIFVHTEKMKRELIEEFGAGAAQVTVIPHGINTAVPSSSLTSIQARQRLGIRDDQRTILFYGRITPYKGLEYLINAFRMVQGGEYRLIIAGRPDQCEEYWSGVQNLMREDVQSGGVIVRAEFIPDEETEIYFKAADVLVLPYRDIFQSGVLLLGYSFGLPALVADVGSLREEIVEGKTGFVFKPEDPADLAKAIERYFASDLFRDLSRRRQEIRGYAMQRYSWDTVGRLTMHIYAGLDSSARFRRPRQTASDHPEGSAL